MAHRRAAGGNRTFVLWHLYRSTVRPLRGLLTLLILTTLAANIWMLLQPVVLAGLLAIVLGPIPQAAAEASQSSALDLSYLGGRVLAWLGPRAQQGLRSAPFLGALFLVQVVLAALLTYVASLLGHRIKVRSAALLQSALAEHLMSLGLRFFYQQRSGELLSRFAQDTRGTAQGLGPIIQSLVNNVTQIALLGFMLVSTSVWLTLGAAVLIVLHFAITGVMKRPARRWGRKGYDAWAELSTTLQEALTNIRVTKSFAAERFELEKLRGQIAHVAATHWRYGYFEKAEVPVRSIVDAAAILGILLIAVVQLREQTLTTQGALLYLFVGRMMIAPISNLASNVLAAQTVLSGYDRIGDLLASPSELAQGRKIKSAFEKSLRVDGVSFAYAKTLVLDSVAVEITRGDMVAVVGPSGSGKSTLIDLILRLYDPNRGTISMDGIDIRDLQHESYLNLFGVVPQESLLFHDTVRNNIVFGRDGITEDDVVRAARIANADGFIRALPLGYDTVIGDRGVRLSGGERQRVAIARAVAHRPQILVLDEATSSLDSESEHQVQDAIDQVVKDTTAIVVAHRLSTVLHADRIVVLDRGRVVDIGRHIELLDRCQLYRSLCGRQFQAASQAAFTTAP